MRRTLPRLRSPLLQLWGARLVLFGFLLLVAGPVACGFSARSSSSFTQGFPGGSFSGEILRADLAADILAVEFEISDPSLQPADFDFRFLIFQDINSDSVYEPGVDITIARSEATVLSKTGGQVPDAHFEWKESDHEIDIVFILTMPGNKTLLNYETLAY
jgi:hypothetical protein